MESDINEQTLKGFDKASHLRQTKLPVRLSSEKHSYKRHSWLLPEGQTVVEKQYRLKKRKHSDNPIRTPLVQLHLDVFILLENLFRLSSEKFDEVSKKTHSEENQDSLQAIKRVIERKEKKVEDLHELYIHQQHMREGATNLIATLESLKPLNKSTKQRLEECKLQRHKNIERLHAIEDELNSMAGSIKFQILGLVGFSRVCPGDVYEVSFKLASQKWKSKCKIEAMGQTWIDPEFHFLAKAAYDMSVKMIEIGKLGKTTVIGSVGCSIQEFLLPEPQVFLLPINSTGTIRLKLGVVWSPFDQNDQREVQINKVPLNATVDFSNIPVINLRSFHEKKYSSPLTRAGQNGDVFNFSLPSHILESSLNDQKVNKGHPALYRSGSDASVYRSPSLGPHSPSHHYHSPSHGKYSPSYGQHSPLNSRSPSHGSSSSVKHSPGASVLAELKRKTSTKINTPKGNIKHGRNSSADGSYNSNSYVDSGYHSSSHEDIRNRRHSISNIGPVNTSTPQKFSDTNSPQKTSDTSPARKTSDTSPARKYSSTTYLNRVNEVPENVQNVVRTTTVPIRANTSVSKEKTSEVNVPLTNGNAQVRRSSTSRTNYSPNNDTVFSANKSPPIVKPKPRIRRASSIDLISESDMSNEKDITIRMIDLCEKIISKLVIKTEITMKVRDIEKKMKEVKSSLERLHAKQQRKPSLTDSITSALDSFAFLKDDDEQSVISNYSPPPDIASVFILPKQWKKSYRTFCHHLYMLYDSISAYTPPLGHLTEQENYVITCIHKQKYFVKELLELISTPDEIELNKVCKKFSGSSTLTNTWEVSAPVDQPLYCTADAMLVTLSALYQHLEIENGGDGNVVSDSKLKKKVCSQAIYELTEAKIYGTDTTIITLLQFVDFFKTKVKSHSVIGFLRTLRLEELTLRNLSSTDDLVVMSTLQQYTTIPISPSCINYLLLFLVNNKSSTKQLALNAIQKLHDSNSKQQVATILLGALEEKDIKLRTGACIALGKCKVHNSSQKLIYLFHNDDVMVKEVAEVALKELGHTHIRR